MYKISLLILTLVSSIALDAQRINFKDVDLKEAKLIAFETNKYLFVDAYTNWCKPCKKMDKEVFSDAAVAKFYNENYIAVKVDLESKKGKKVQEEYNIMALPTFLFFNPQGELVHRSEGALSAMPFVNLGKKSLDTNQQIYTLQEKVNSGNEASREDLYHLAMGTYEAKEPYHNELAQYLGLLLDDTVVMDKMNMDVLFYLNRDINNEYYAHFTDALVLFQDRYTYTEVQNKLKADGERAYRIAVDDLDEGKLEIAKNFNYKYNGTHAEREALQISLEFYSKIGEWDTYAALAEAYIERFLKAGGLSKFEAVEVYNIVAELDVGSNDQAVLKKAMGWCEEILHLRTNAYVYETYASILLQLGHTSSARRACQRAISLANSNGDDPSSAQSLLNVINQ